MRETILTAAMLLAEKDRGFSKLTRDGVAKRAGVAAGLVTYYFKSMPKLRSAVVRKAIEEQNLPILGQAIGSGLVASSETAATSTRPYVPEPLRAKAIRSLLQ